VRVDLHRNVNFIHGRNGSGKSAILAGIQFVFGVSARDIGRGRAAKDMIRDGTDTCEVIIEMYNEGTHAWRPDLFPGVIVFTRTASLKGASKLKMSDSKGPCAAFPFVPADPSPVPCTC
jgi:structural maintenance of chromosomes protein 6